jgi:hypothetical protein
MSSREQGRGNTGLVTRPLHASRQGSTRPFYCVGILYRYTNRVETGPKEGMLTGDSRSEDSKGKGEMVVNESRLG